MNQEQCPICTYMADLHHNIVVQHHVEALLQGHVEALLQRLEECDEVIDQIRRMLAVREGESLIEEIDTLRKQIFSPRGQTHHNAWACPYCQENLNVRSELKEDDSRNCS
jgi:hypothetical protein